MKRQSVVAVIIKEGKVLMLKRHPFDRTLPNLYCLPGGKVDDTDETLEKALIREVFEETEMTLLHIHSGNWRAASWMDSEYLNRNFYGWSKSVSAVRRRLICVAQGFHSVNDKLLLGHFDWDYRLYECTIPAASEYYTNTRGLYVSNKIIINVLNNGI